MRDTGIKLVSLTQRFVLSFRVPSQRDRPSASPMTRLCEAARNPVTTFGAYGLQSSLHRAAGMTVSERLRGRCSVYILSRIYTGGSVMATTRVFKSGNSQAVRLPKQFQFRGKEVEIFRRGDEVVLREKSRGLERAFWLLASLPDDFFAGGRDDPPPQRTGRPLMSARYLLDTNICIHQRQRPPEVLSLNSAG